MIPAFRSAQTQTQWALEFSRKLKTGEATDVEIVPGKKMLVMLAHAGKMDPKEEHKKTERWYLEDFVF